MTGGCVSEPDKDPFDGTNPYAGGAFDGVDDTFNGQMNVHFPVEPFAGVGEMLARSFQSYRDNFSLIFKLALLLLLPLVLVEHALHAIGPWSQADAMHMRTWGMGWLMRAVVDFVLSCLMIPAVIFGVVVREREGRVAAVGESLGWAVRKWLPCIGWGLVVTLITLLGCVLAIVPALFAMTWFFMIYAVITVEGHTGNAMTRCIELTRGHAWPIFGIVVVLWVLLMGVSMGLSFVMGVAYSAAPIGWPLFALLNWCYELLWPLLTVAGACLYLSLRERGPVAHCLRCGYSLAGNTTGYCPECGEVLPSDAITDMPST